jgi:hypothetical protein
MWNDLQDFPALTLLVIALVLVTAVSATVLATVRALRLRRRTAVASSTVVDRGCREVLEAVVRRVGPVAEVSAQVGHSFMALPRRGGVRLLERRRAQCLVTVEPLDTHRTLVQFQGLVEPPLQRAIDQLISTSFRNPGGLSLPAPQGTFVVAALNEPTPFATN